MKRTLLAAALASAVTAVAAPASAAVTFVFTPGPAYSPGPGFVLINDFNDAGTALDGFDATSNIVLQAGSNTDGAQPGNSQPGDTQYLSVLTGGTATYTFTDPTAAFQFDWGSADQYNVLTIYTNLGSYTKGGAFIPPANGDQGANATNGLFTAWAGPGEVITGFKLYSAHNSFEIDNLAVKAVPEPGTWALMIMGFAGLGAVMRRRRDQSVMQAA